METQFIIYRGKQYFVFKNVFKWMAYLKLIQLNYLIKQISVDLMIWYSDKED